MLRWLVLGAMSMVALSADAPAVSLGEIKFDGGEVKLASRSLEKTLPKVAECVGSHGGLDGESGFLLMEFIVRVRGRAEGVEVKGRKGVSEDAGRCVRKTLQNRWVGTPSADPVGVTVRYELKPAG